jgi:hypothetical protein
LYLELIDKEWGNMRVLLKTNKNWLTRDWQGEKNVNISLLSIFYTQAKIDYDLFKESYLVETTSTLAS